LHFELLKRNEKKFIFAFVNSPLLHGEHLASVVDYARADPDRVRVVRRQRVGLAFGQPAREHQVALLGVVQLEPQRERRGQQRRRRDGQLSIK